MTPPAGNLEAAMAGDVYLGPRYAEVTFDLNMTPAGVLWAWAVVEELNSARWSLALREGRRLRERAARWSAVVYFEHKGWGAWESERSGGIPSGWWGRP